jgi:Cytochrome b(C-terminal)/b6/petD
MLIFFFDLLPFYAILRSIPNKLLGVIAMFSAILILLAMPFTDLSRSRGIQFRPLSKIAFYVFIGNFLILMQLGAKHVESPFIEFGQISTAIYFAHFLIIVPLISLIENSLIELNISSKNSNKTPIKGVRYLVQKAAITFMAASAAVATPEEIAEKQSALSYLANSRDNLLAERSQINRAHSYAGDHNLPNEAELGRRLENIDGLKEEVQSKMADLTTWLFGG